MNLSLVWENAVIVSRFLATFGTAGVHLPWGLGFGLAVVSGLAWFWILHAKYPRGAWAVVLLLASGASVVIGAAEEALGKDSSTIVLDEFVAVPFVFLFHVPWRHAHASLSALGGLILFVVIDNLKPLGLHTLEQLPGGFGVVMDDVGAAFVASAVLWFLLHSMHRSAERAE